MSVHQTSPSALVNVRLCQTLTFGGDPASSVQRQKMGFSEEPVSSTRLGY